MQKTALLIIFYLLQNKENINKTMRQIAAETATSIGSVHSTLAELTEDGFIVDSGTARLLRKRQILIARWVNGYAETLKKNLFMGRFAFLKPSVKRQWETIPLPASVSWGGEAAVALLDGFLIPERWDVYTEGSASPLIATGRMIPSAEGEIFVYRKFWRTPGTPLLVIYADLLATGNDRCREAAERIKSQI